ncbi:DUF1738 domain-containing protein [Rubellimicrobium rubrum]|uniref:DUF1738 domain-containing protein n=1 Tax=Rubellimicrobium rubrum TaxID=2585369 RepID=A0A5C4MJ37_9RHOB|nr:zincin-like metallopeptidase domain-containing protein [Rubellimicrobium rubrum]TNC45038.1 DUF1738 domain-containing protein [Rubellimicrobium rubrum]
MASQTPKTFDPEREISERIIAALEAGTPPWRKPWTGQGGGTAFPLRATGEAYRGINVLMLWLEASEKAYASPYWMTYRQAQELGGQVRKGERSALVVKYGVVEREREEAAEGHEAKAERRPYLKAYHVFNADQVDGLPERFTRKAEPAMDLGTRPDEALDTYFGRLGAAIETSPDPRAYYHPARDVIHMPPISTFHTTQGYYETLGHEAVHWTGGTARLDRLTRCKDRQAYAFEELVAEIGQCLLFATLGLTPSIDQSAAYVEGWLKALAEDKKAIFRAASEAQKAVDLITERCGSAVEQHQEVAA